MKNKIGLFIILLGLPLLLSGCHLPLINKEVTLPFFEKKPDITLEKMISNMAGVKTINSKTDVTISFNFNTLSRLPDANKEKISRFFGSLDQNRTRVLGIDNYSTSTDEDGLFYSFFKPGNYKININQTSQIDQTDKNIPRFNAESIFNITLPNESYKFAFAAKGVDNKNYFQIKELPSFVEAIMSNFLESGTSTLGLKDWWVLDNKEMERIAEENNDVPAGFIPDINNEEIKKMQAEIETVVRESSLIRIDNRLRDEKIGSHNCYHYQMGIKEENFSTMMKKIVAIYKKQLTSFAPNFPLGDDLIDKYINNLSQVIKNVKGELWIGKKDFYLYKITARLEYDLKNLNFSEGKNNLPSMPFAIDYTQEYSDYNQALSIEAPAKAESITKLLETNLMNARRRSRDAKRVSDIKQIQTALELYFNDNEKYPESTSSLSYFLPFFPTNPTPNDGNCPADFQYQYQVKQDGQAYELTYCLGEMTGRIPAGISTSTPAGMYQGDAGYSSYSYLNFKSSIDTDQDGLFDYEEKEIYHSDPNKNDTDGDGFSDGQEIAGWYDPNGKGKLPDPYSSPEGTLIALEKEVYNGNFNLYIPKVYYSDDLIKLLKDDFNMTKEEFDKRFVEIMKEEPAIKGLTINLTNKTTEDENNVLLDYEVKSTDMDGKISSYSDNAYLIKQNNIWMIDLGKEFFNLKENSPFMYQAVVDKYKE